MQVKHPEKVSVLCCCGSHLTVAAGVYSFNYTGRCAALHLAWRVLKSAVA